MSPSTETLLSSLIPMPHPKIGERVWSHLQKFLYVLCQQSSFGVEGPLPINYILDLWR